MEKRESNRPSNNPLTQQRMWAFQPVHTLKSTLVILLSFGVLLLIFGISFYAEANSIVEVSKRYDDCESAVCTVSLDIPEEMNEPIYLYYELRNFYQNHRLYVKSRSHKQLKGEDVSFNDIEDDCDPIVKVSDLREEFRTTLNKQVELASPCGLTANSIFTDVFSLPVGSISESDIAWDSDLSIIYKTNGFDEGDQWIDVENNEHFAVWMRLAIIPTFRKLWGVIETDVPKGNFILEIENKYDVSPWDGEKHVVLTTSGPLGGQNYVLPVVFLVAGVLCISAAVLFFSLKSLLRSQIEADRQLLR